MRLIGNNLIAVNILASYARIVVLAALTLFSSRWVLSALGEIDFGLYNVVGGLIVFILFLGNTLANSVQRFYAYSIGSDNFMELQKWFNCAFVLHTLFAILLLLIGIPLGNFLLEQILNLPMDRLSTCKWIYYFSVFSAVETMIFIPYWSMFYAKQRIFELTLWTSLQTILTFMLAWKLLSMRGDLLLFYSIGVVFIKLFIDIIVFFRSISTFNECKIKSSFIFNKTKIIKLVSFAGWNLFGAFGGVVKNQGLSLLINIFTGPKVNAAFGIANQFASQTNNISSAIAQAISPEVTRREGQGNRAGMISLSLKMTKLIILLTFFWAIPIFFEMDYLLKIWLKTPPPHAANFCKIILLAYIIDKSTAGYMEAVKAFGKIALYQFVQGGILILTFPLSWLVFMLGGSPEVAVCMLVVTSTGFSTGRIFWVKKLMNVSPLSWINSVFTKCAYVAIPSIITCLALKSMILPGLFRFFIIMIVSATISIIFCWIFSLTSSEKNFIKNKIIFIINKFIIFNN